MSKRKKKPGYFVGVSRTSIIDMAEKLGEVHQRREGEPYYPDLIFVMLSQGGQVDGVVITWMNDRVSFAKYHGNQFLWFASEHMDTVSELQGLDGDYGNPMTLYKAKAAEAGIASAVVNYMTVEFNG